MVAGFVDPRLLIPGFLTLSVAGLILGLCLLRTGALYRSIGLHAGWIFWLRFYHLLTLEQPKAQENLSFWGTGKLFDGWLAFIILLPLCFLIWRKYTVSNESGMDFRSEKLA
jgi:hypothetical protein